MDKLLCCWFGVNHNDPLEFSTECSRDADLNNKLREIRQTLSNHYSASSKTVRAHRPTSESKLVTESIPLYEQLGGQLVARGVSIDVVYSVPS